MPTDTVTDLLKDELTSSEVIDNIFNYLENKWLDKSETLLDFRKVTFISVYFLERLDKFVLRAKDLKVQVKINNVPSSIYKVLQVAKVSSILEVCC